MVESIHNCLIQLTKTSAFHLNKYTISFNWPIVTHRRMVLMSLICVSMKSRMHQHSKTKLIDGGNGVE